MSPSQPSQVPMAFPPYRRSHLRSKTYNTLVHILSHLNIPDNGSGRMGQENQEKELQCSELKVGSDYTDPKGPVIQKEIHETIDDQSKDTSGSKMILDDIELLMGSEEISVQTNGIHLEKKLMDELELVVKGTEDSIQDDALIPVNSVPSEKQDSGSKVDLMDYEIEHVEFLHSDANTSANASELQVAGELTQLATSANASELPVPGELNQLASEGFHVSIPTKGEASASVIATSTLQQEIQQKEAELVNSVCPVVNSFPLDEEGKFEKEKQYGQKVAEAAHISLDRETDTEAMNMSEDVGLLDSTILKDKHETQNGEKFCENNATDSSIILIKEGGLEDGEISGEFEMDGNMFDVSSEQMKVDEVQKTEKQNQILQDANSNGQVESRDSNKNGIACGIELPVTQKTFEFDKAGKYGSTLKPENCLDRYGGNKGINDTPIHLTRNQVMYNGIWEETTTKDHGNPSTVQMVDASRKKKRGGSKTNKNETKMVDASRKRKRGDSKTNKNETEEVDDASRKRKHVPDSEDNEDKNQHSQMVDGSRSKKRGPVTQETKNKKRMKYRKKRAAKNRELGVDRLKLPPVQKPKPISFCRHYLKGRCHEGDKCKFSHDTVPSTKSTPCHHFARSSCMKGDDCPFDHQLSKYPCNNFVSTGSCSRGAACLFSHQVPTNQDTPTPSNVCKPELKSPLVSGNTNFSMPPNNHGCNSAQQNHFTKSKGIYSHINAEQKPADTPRMQPTSAPKGIRFINVANLSPSPSAPKHDMVTPSPKSILRNGTCAGQGASGTTQNTVEIPKKLPAVAPKGINFLSFGNGPVCSFKSSISSHVNRESGIKLPQLVNAALPKKAGSSLNKDDNDKVSDKTKKLPQTTMFSHEVLDKSQSMEEGNKLKFPGKASTDDCMREHSHCKSVQEGIKASDTLQAASVTSSMLLARPFVSHQLSECLVSGYHKQASNSGQRALLSTLAFAAEHESDIKMKCPTGASPV